MKKLIIIPLLFLFINTFSQDIVGKWKTIDDKNGEVKSIIEIYEKNNLYYGKISIILNKENRISCGNCNGKYHNKNLTNLVILKDLKRKETLYEDGSIMDPESAKLYSCYLELVKEDKLKVRGFIGFSLLGRTQYWYRIDIKEEKILINK